MNRECSDGCSFHLDAVSEDDTVRSIPEYVNLDDVINKIGLGWPQFLICVVCGLASFTFSGQAMIPVLLTDSIWQQWPSMSSNYEYNFLYFLIAIANIFGAFMFGAASDVFGRYLALICSLSCSIVFCLLSAGSTSFGFYLALRAFSSFGTAGLSTIFYVYLMECVPVPCRSLIATILTMCGTTGVIYVEGINWALESTPHSWRYVVLISAIPGLVAVICLLCKRLESPKFLATNSDDSVVWECLENLAGSQSRLFQKLDITTTEGLTFRPPAPLNESPSVENPNKPLLEKPLTFWSRFLLTFKRVYYLLKTRSMWSVMFRVSGLWFCQSLSYWGFTSYIPSFFASENFNDRVCTIGSFVIQYPGLLLSWVLMTRSNPFCSLVSRGRKGAITIFTQNAFFCGLTLTIGLGAGVAPGWIMSSAFLMYFFAGPLWNLMYIYTTELFPPESRGGAMAFVCLVHNIPTLFDFFIGEAAVKLSTPWVYPCIWTCSYFIVCVFAITLPSQLKTSTPVIDSV